MSAMFNKDVLEGKWKELRGRVRQQWGKLTDDELDRISGRYDELTGLVQQKYGYTVEKARDEVDQFIKKLDRDKDMRP